MSRDYNEEAQDTTNIYNYNFDDKMNEFKIKNLLELIDRSKISNVLEVGCFEGGMTKILNQTFLEVDVVDAAIDGWLSYAIVSV